MIENYFDPRRYSIYQLGLTRHVLVVGYLLLTLQALLMLGVFDPPADQEHWEAPGYAPVLLWALFMAPAIKAVGGGFAALKYQGRTRWLGVVLLLTIFFEYQFIIKALCVFLGACWGTPTDEAT